MAQPRIQKFTVPNVQVMEARMTSFLAQGFIVAHKTDTSVTLQKKKEFNIVWAIVGLVLCILPLLIYLIVYITRPDVELIEIAVSRTAIQPI
jgi:hypothetical protein